jgi:hypothetical protein
MDEWLATGPTTRTKIRTFVVRANKSKVTGQEGLNGDKRIIALSRTNIRLAARGWGVEPREKDESGPPVGVVESPL